MNTNNSYQFNDSELPTPSSVDDLNNYLRNRKWRNRSCNKSTTTTYSDAFIGASIYGLLNMRNTDTEE